MKVAYLKILPCLALMQGLVWAQTPGPLSGNGAASISVSAIAAKESASDLSLASCVADIGVILSADATVEKAFQEFASQRGIAYGIPDARGFVYQAVSATVNAGPQSPSFVTERMSAFARAYGDAVARHIQCMKEKAHVDAKAAMESRAGVCVVKTAEGLDGADGMYKVGVILKYDPFLAGLLHSLADKSPLVPSSAKGLPARAILAGEGARMVQNFGIRFYYDENGRPALLAFGQWPAAAGLKDPRQAIQVKNDALAKAGRLASAFLDAFLAEHSLSMDNQDISHGVQTLFQDVLKHPSGVDIAVTAYGWNFQEAQNQKPSSAEAQKTTTFQPVGEFDF